MATQKRAEGDPAGKPRRAAIIMMRAAPPIEEAPGARAGPRRPDAFYRGEEAGAAPNPTEHDEMERLASRH